MIWIVILSTAIAVISIGIVIAQGRQIREICRQLAFLRENDSSLSITLRLHTPAMKCLQGALNAEIGYFREQVQETMVKEKHLKQSITDLSHDIRTPLTSLDGYFQLLQTTKDAEKQQKYCDIISERIGVLRELLEELFTYARLQDENDTLDCEEMPVNSVILHTLLSFYNELRSRGTEPRVHIPEETVTAFCNENALRRVVQNIVKNALMHGSTDKPFLQVSLQEEADTVRLTVTNRCADPSALDMERIFDRFYRADSARSRRGAGLGLSIAQGLTQKMGGTIRGDLQEDLFTVTVVLKRR